MVASPGLVVFSIARLATTALVGFAAGTMVTRDPESARRTLRRVVCEASRGVESATRLAAGVREQFGDLVAEAREEARADPARQRGEAVARWARGNGSPRQHGGNASQACRTAAAPAAAVGLGACASQLPWQPHVKDSGFSVTA